MKLSDSIMVMGAYGGDGFTLDGARTKLVIIYQLLSGGITNDSAEHSMPVWTLLREPWNSYYTTIFLNPHTGDSGLS